MMNDPGDENDYAVKAQRKGKLKFDEVVGHPNLSKQVNDNILTSAINGGVHIKDLKGKGYKVATANTVYELRQDPLHKGGDYQWGWFIKGHPKYCPNFVPCSIHGSTWGGSMLKIGFIGRGMHLEVGLIVNGKPQVLTTTCIAEVEEI